MKSLGRSIQNLWQQLKKRWIPLLLGLFSFIGMLSWAEDWYASKRTQKMAIGIQNQASFKLVKVKDVKDLLDGHLPANFSQYTLQNLPLREMESLLEKQAFIANAEIFTHMDGKIAVQIEQRTPLVRIINSDQNSFYLDQSGKRMPFSPAYKKPLITATGHIKANRRESLNQAMKRNLTNIYQVSRHIKADSFLTALTGQLYLNKDHDIQLIPRIGEQTIVVGQARNLPARFAKLKAFYRKVLPHEGWYTYDKINLKYHKQIVAKK
jgi:hypothetical protein